MDIYKLKFTRLQNEIFRLMSIKAGEKLNQRKIANALKVSPTAVAKALKLLEKEGLIKITKSDFNLNLVELNRDNKKTLELKLVENLKMIYETNILQELEESFPGTTIILFGSYSRGEDTTKSDIDIAIIEAKNKSINLKKYEDALQREIRINFYKDFQINKELKENLCNGITLVGGMKL